MASLWQDTSVSVLENSRGIPCFHHFTWSTIQQEAILYMEMNTKGLPEYHFARVQLSLFAMQCAQNSRH